jgi:branched-chain amino acid transport system ATP-binding protein
MSLLELKEVHTYYGHIHALKGISLRVEEGEIVTLIGSNGAGKSTTLRTISGLVKPRQGEVLYQGKPIHRLPAHQIVALGVGHVPEGRKIFPRLTVEENLEIGAYLEKDRRVVRRSGRSRSSPSSPASTSAGTRRAGTLSGGEQQMLAIGRALMQNPRILLMDEPSMGLAPVLVDFIFETIKKLNQEGKTILLVEQNARLALQIAHRGYVLATGEITLTGPAGAFGKPRGAEGLSGGD